MSAKFDTVSVTLSADTGFGGTFTASYPTGRTAEDYLGATSHRIFSTSYRALYAVDGDFTVAFGASITITMTTGLSLADGSVMYLELDRAERDDDGGLTAGESLADATNMTIMTPTKIDLGAPIAPDPNGYVVSQNLTAAGVFSSSVTVDVALAAGALAGTADFARNVVGAWTGTAIATVTGTDHYGNAMVESSASGTTMAGKKAFKTVTDFTVSADVTGLTVGSGDVLGLPVFVADAGDVFAEYEDGAAPTAGTIVAGATATATATTGDVRGTYDPNSACNGTKEFDLAAMVRSTSYKGITQYSV